MPLAYEQKQNVYKLEVAEKSLSVASSFIDHSGNDNDSPFASFEEITRFVNNWMIDRKDKYKKKISRTYLNN